MSPFRVLALDLPGHGRSEGRCRQSIKDYARVIADWSKALGLPGAIFVGHSMGAAIILSLAVQFPEQVKGLAILGGGNKLKVAPWLLEATSSSLTFSTAVERVVQWSFHPDTPEKIKTLTARHMLENRPSVVHSDFMACNGYEAGERVKEVLCPALILCAPDDKMVPISQSQYLAASIPDARLVIIPERPQAVCEALTDFGLSIFQ